jgi:hypothetical protein
MEMRWLLFKCTMALIMGVKPGINFVMRWIESISFRGECHINTRNKPSLKDIRSKWVIRLVQIGSAGDGRLLPRSMRCFINPGKQPKVYLFCFPFVLHASVLTCHPAESNPRGLPRVRLFQCQIVPLVSPSLYSYDTRSVTCPISSYHSWPCKGNC